MQKLIDHKHQTNIFYQHQL